MIEIKDLKRARKALGMTQLEVAVRVGVSMQSYALWERGAMKPDPNNEKKLRKVLKIGV